MIKKILILLAVVILAFAPASAVFAQGEGEDPTLTPTEEPTVEPTEEPLTDICVGSDPHPVAKALAERFEVTYEEIMGWFCEDQMGMGEIGLALVTAQVLAEEDEAPTLEEIMSQRLDEGLGWGQIWQNLGLIGNGQNNGVGPENGRGPEKDKDADQDQDQEHNKPDIPPGLDEENDKGKPDNPGNSPEDKDKEKDKDRGPSH